MDKPHEPLVWVGDQGLLEIECTCGRMNRATGRKMTIQRAWDSHLGYFGVKPTEAGKLYLNMFTDPDGEPAKVRDLSQFTAIAAEGMRKALERTAAWLARKASGETTETEDSGLPADTDPEPGLTDPPKKRVRKRGPGVPRPPKPYGHGIQIERTDSGLEAISFRGDRQRRDLAVVWSFTAANRLAVDLSYPKLTQRERNSLIYAMEVVAVSEFFDLFRYPRLLALFADEIGVSADSLRRVLSDFGLMLADSPGMRFRVREMMNSVGEKDQIWLIMPPGWQLVLSDFSDD